MFPTHWPSGLPLITTLLSAILVSACGVPANMQVRSGVEPDKQDEDVRFRVTYYYRVFNVCQPKDPAERPLQPRIDSLYRFTMTGKAFSLTTKVKFESGVLDKSVIEPFGKSVDTANNAISTPAPAALTTEQIKTAVQEAMQPPSKNTPGTDKLSAEEIAAAVKKGVSDALHNGSVKTGECPYGYSAEQRFQIWGPEGWRPFNRNERLVMAMSTSAEPLISSLERVSRIQQAGSDAVFTDAILDIELEATNTMGDALEDASLGAAGGDFATKINAVINAYTDYKESEQ